MIQIFAFSEIYPKLDKVYLKLEILLITDFYFYKFYPASL